MNWTELQICWTTEWHKTIRLRTGHVTLWFTAPTAYQNRQMSLLTQKMNFYSLWMYFVENVHGVILPVIKFVIIKCFLCLAFINRWLKKQTELEWGVLHKQHPKQTRLVACTVLCMWAWMCVLWRWSIQVENETFSLSISCMHSRSSEHLNTKF